MSFFILILGAQTVKKIHPREMNFLVGMFNDAEKMDTEKTKNPTKHANKNPYAFLKKCQKMLTAMEEEDVHLTPWKIIEKSDEHLACKDAGDIEVLGSGGFGVVLANRTDPAMKGKAVKMLWATERDFIDVVCEISFHRKYSIEARLFDYEESVAKFYDYYFFSFYHFEEEIANSSLGLIHYYKKFADIFLQRKIKELEEDPRDLEEERTNIKITDAHDRIKNLHAAMKILTGKGKDARTAVEEDNMKKITEEIKQQSALLASFRNDRRDRAVKLCTAEMTKRMVGIIVMERINNGVSAQKFLDDNFKSLPIPPPLNTAADPKFTELVKNLLIIYREAFISLERVHALQIFHGDPSLRNIMLRNSRAGSRSVVLLDFGASCYAHSVKNDERKVADRVAACTEGDLFRWRFSKITDFHEAYKEGSKNKMEIEDFYSHDFFLLSAFFFRSLREHSQLRRGIAYSDEEYNTEMISIIKEAEDKNEETEDALKMSMPDSGRREREEALTKSFFSFLPNEIFSVTGAMPILNLMRVHLVDGLDFQIVARRLNPLPREPYLEEAPLPPFSFSFPSLAAPPAPQPAEPSPVEEQEKKKPRNAKISTEKQ